MYETLSNTYRCFKKKRKEKTTLKTRQPLVNLRKKGERKSLKILTEDIFNPSTNCTSFSVSAETLRFMHKRTAHLNYSGRI